MPPTTTAPAAAPIAARGLTALYERVGLAIARRGEAQGEDATRRLRRRYAAISYLEALRKPALRAEALAELQSLARDLGLR